jgi:hypothetical protein
MNLFRRFQRSLALACVLLLLTPIVMPVHAAMVGTDSVLSDARGEADRTEVLAFLDRDDVRAQMEALGVDPAAAEARVAAMTDAEIAELHARMDEIPAGGASVLSVALVILIVFVITDVIGATDIFPFIRPVN